MHEPYGEYRVRFIERQINTLGANIERLYDDQTEGLKILKQEMKQEIRQEIEQAYLHIGKTIDDHTQALMEEIRKRTEPIEKSVNEHTKRLDQVEARLDQVEARLDRIEVRLDRIEATMATKDDLAAMESRIIDTLLRTLKGPNV